MIALRQRLMGPPAAFGAWLALDNTVSAETMGRVGFDVVIVDTQHGAASEAALLPLLQALDATGTPALVRVPWLDAARIMRAVDLGAAGVVVPMVNTTADAERAVAAMRYPPRGFRSFGPVRRWYSSDGAAADPLCLVMIETSEALANLEAIAATPGLDGLLVGPVDLGLSLGHGLSLEMAPEVMDAIAAVAEACRKHGLICASVSFGPDNAALQLGRGVTFLATGSDSLFMRRAAEAELAQMRKLASE